MLTPQPTGWSVCVLCGTRKPYSEPAHHRSRTTGQRVPGASRAPLIDPNGDLAAACQHHHDSDQVLTAFRLAEPFLQRIPIDLEDVTA